MDSMAEIKELIQAMVQQVVIMSHHVDMLKIHHSLALVRLSLLKVSSKTAPLNINSTPPPQLPLPPSTTTTTNPLPPPSPLSLAPPTPAPMAADSATTPLTTTTAGSMTTAPPSPKFPATSPTLAAATLSLHLPSFSNPPKYAAVGCLNSKALLSTPSPRAPFASSVSTPPRQLQSQALTPTSQSQTPTTPSRTPSTPLTIADFGSKPPVPPSPKFPALSLISAAPAPSLTFHQTPQSPSQLVTTSPTDPVSFFQTMSLMKRLAIASESIYISKLIGGYNGLNTNYEHTLFGLMLERNGKKIFEHALFIFDPGGETGFECFFVAWLNGDAQLKNNPSSIFPIPLPPTSDLEDKVDFEGTVMIRQYVAVHSTTMSKRSITIPIRYI